MHLQRPGKQWQQEAQEPVHVALFWRPTRSLKAKRLQQPNFQQPPPGWQPQQPVQQWQQQHGGQQNQAPYQQNTGGPVSGQQQGNGNGAPSRGQGNYQGQQQGNYGSDRGHQRRQSTRCTRCGSLGHVTSGCQNPEKCFNCNGYIKTYSTY